MALFAKCEAFRRVPWFSLTEWHQVYEQIYSSDTAQQTNGYETLLIWKARMPKLPVGVECTLSLMQVCLKDREWVPRINNGKISMYIENDLCLMYSTTIMRFLNQISNIGHTKQRSLFQIAKQLQIPEWIVNLRHDVAHGHELPDISLLRMAANVLLIWLHDEYWTAEGQAFEAQYTKESEIIETDNIESSLAVVDLTELWMAVGLYIETGYILVSDLPDNHLQETLNELRTYMKKSHHDINTDSIIDENYRLATARSYILVEISALLDRYKSSLDKKEVFMNVLLDSEAFLPTLKFFKFFSQQSNQGNVEIQLPPGIIKFWQDFIYMLHKKNLLDSLTLTLLEYVSSSNEDKHKRLFAALWINSIAQSLMKLKLLQYNAQILEHTCIEKDKRMTPKLMQRKLREKIHNEHPELNNVLWLSISNDVSTMFTNMNFVRDIAHNPNEFTMKFFKSVLNLVMPSMDEINQHYLLQLVSIYTINDKVADRKNNETNTVYTIRDFEKILHNQYPINRSCEMIQQKQTLNIVDMKIRNNKWEFAQINCDWKIGAFGILPWQIDSLEMLPADIPTKFHCPNVMLNIVPGLVDNKHLLSSSQVDWEKILRKKQRTRKRKQKGDADIMMNKAIEVVKTKKL